MQPRTDSRNSQTAREADCKELNELLNRAADRRARKLSPEDLMRLGALYRRVTVHLSQARTRLRDQHLAESLNQLVARAHGQIYRPAKRAPLRAALRLFHSGFPIAVRSIRAEVLLCLTVLILSTWLGWRLVDEDPARYYALVPIEEMRSPGASTEELLASLKEGRDGGFDERATFSGFLWQHNTRVALLAFAAGAFGGFIALILVAYNGLMLGAMTSLFVNVGLGTSWWAWLAGHGVTELGAIALASAAGLALGRRLLFPGALKRADALRELAPRVLPVAGGAAFMLLIAALLEGFFRQSAASDLTRFLVAGATGIAWLSYFLLAGRAPRPRLARASANNDSIPAPSTLRARDQAHESRSDATR